jgi:hypothetical protein
LCFFFWFFPLLFPPVTFLSHASSFFWSRSRKLWNATSVI